MRRFHPDSGWDVQHGLLPGSLHVAKLPVKLSGSDTGLLLEAALNLDRLTLKVERTIIWDGDVIALNWEVSRTKENAVHRVMLMQAETLDPYDPKLSAGEPPRSCEEAVLQTKNSRLVRKLQQTILPKLVLKNADLITALAFIETECNKVAIHGTNFPDIHVKFAAKPPGELESQTLLDLDVFDVPLLEGLRFITENVGLRFYEMGDVVIVTYLHAGWGDEFETKEFKVPPHFREWLEAQPVVVHDGVDPFAPKPDPGRVDPFSVKSAPAGVGSPRSLSMRSILENIGFGFPEGASATEVSADGILRYTTRAFMMYEIEGLIEKAWAETAAPLADEAKKLVLPKVELRSVALKEAVDAILINARVVNPKAEIKVRMEEGCDGARTLTWSGEKTPVFEALITVAKLAGHEVRADKSGISIRRETKP